jgi:hypothetical protein
MANEFRHNTVGTDLTQAEFEAVGLHIFNNQAAGDMPVATSATQISRLPVGTLGQGLKSNGVMPFWSSDLSLVSVQTFPAGSGTYTKNTNATKILVEGVAGGGGGGGANGNNAGMGAGGGGGGSYFRRFITSPNTSYSYVVGAGGGRGLYVSGTSGNNGANTTFDAAGTQNLLAPGGALGSGTGSLVSNSNPKICASGAGGVTATGNGSVAGDVFIAGNPGDIGVSASRTSSHGGAGGSSFFGGAGGGGNANAANANGEGNAGGNYGGGGGGGAGSANAAGTFRGGNGGNGGGGILIVWEFA